MYKLLKDILKLLSKKDKFTFIILVVFLFFTTIFEIVGLALILPFLLLINNLELIETNNFIQSIYILFDSENKLEFLYSIGSLAIVFSFIGMVLAIYTNLKLVKYSNNVGASFSVRLFKTFSMKTKKEDLRNRDLYRDIRKKIISESSIISTNIILPSINIISRLILIFILLSILLIINYKFTLFIIFYLLIFYVIILKLSRNIINNNIKKIHIYKKEKEELFIKTFNMKNEDLGNDNNNNMDEYKLNTYKLAESQATNSAISKLPRYVMMFLVFSSVTGFLMYLFGIKNDGIGSIMHTILIFLIVGLKILPQLQSLYINYIKIQSNRLSFYNIYNELYKK